MEENKGRVIKPRKMPFVLLESGHKKFYKHDMTFTYLQDRMVGGGSLDEIY